MAPRIVEDAPVMGREPLVDLRLFGERLQVPGRSRTASGPRRPKRGQVMSEAAAQAVDGKPVQRRIFGSDTERFRQTVVGLRPLGGDAQGSIEQRRRAKCRLDSMISSLCSPILPRTSLYLPGKDAPTQEVGRALESFFHPLPSAPAAARIQFYSEKSARLGRLFHRKWRHAEKVPVARGHRFFASEPDRSNSTNRDTDNDAPTQT